MKKLIAIALMTLPFAASAAPTVEAALTTFLGKTSVSVENEKGCRFTLQDGEAAMTDQYGNSQSMNISYVEPGYIKSSKHGVHFYDGDIYSSHTFKIRRTLFKHRYKVTISHNYAAGYFNTTDRVSCVFDTL